MNACRNETNSSRMLMAVAMSTGAPAIAQLSKLKMSPRMASSTMCPAVMLANRRMASANGLVSLPTISTGLITKNMMTRMGNGSSLFQ